MVFKAKGVGCLPPGSGPLCRAGGVGAPLPTRVNLSLENDRTSIYAAHFNYTLGDLLGIPLKTATRGELAYYPSEPYNISNYPGRNCSTGALTGLRAGPSCKYPSQVVEKNTLRYALGFDRTTFIPLLHPDDPWRSFGISFQVFQRIIFNHEDGIRFFSTAEKLRKYRPLLP